MDGFSARSDEELVAHYREGDEQAFVALVNRYLKPLYNFVYRLSGDEKDAEEISQESFVKIWKNIGRFRTGQKFKTWAYTIARNTAIDWLRKRKHVPLSAFDADDGANPIEDTLADTEKLSDELFEDAERRRAAERLLAGLADTYREVLVLRYHEELEFDEIAAVLGKPLNTVKSQHRRGLIALRKAVADAPKTAGVAYNMTKK